MVFSFEGDDWISAFDENGNLAGASQLIVNNGDAYINLVIYGDDATTSNIDEYEFWRRFLFTLV